VIFRPPAMSHARRRILGVSELRWRCACAGIRGFGKRRIALDYERAAAIDGARHVRTSVPRDLT
jgi:hypothetical protein